MIKKMFIYPTISIIFVLLLFACGVTTYVPRRELEQAFRQVLSAVELALIALAFLIPAGIVIGGLIILARFSGDIWHQWRLRSAEALEAMHNAIKAGIITTVAAPGYQITETFVTPKLAGDAVSKLYHLGDVAINGKTTELTPEQKQRYAFYQLAHSTTSKPDVVVEEMPRIDAALPAHIYLEHYLLGRPSIRNIFLGIGRFPDGQVRPVSAPLAQLVHIAIGGSSGFGKSFMMQSLAYQALNAKEDVRPVLLDAQGVTFTTWAGNDRTLYPLASEPGDIEAVLYHLSEELARRQRLFAAWRGVDKLDAYNAVAEEPLPLLPVFFDEFGLVADNKNIARYVTKLSQAGRKVGIPLIAGAQTWYADEIASNLKANLSTSIQFHARSKSQSRVLIDDSRAIELERPGQALAILPGQPGLIELQAPDVSNLIDSTPELLKSGDMIEMPAAETVSGNIDTSRVLELFESGEYTNPTAICRRLLGYKNQAKVDEVRQVMIDAGLIG